MKKRFGKAAFTGTLSQGLYPAITEMDTLSPSFSFNFSFQEGVELLDLVSTSLPALLSASLTQVVQYPESFMNSTTTSALPQLLSANLTQVVHYLEEQTGVDSISAALPGILTATLDQVVQIHTLYDALAGRPEDTLHHTYTLEFS